MVFPYWRFGQPIGPISGVQQFPSDRLILENWINMLSRNVGPLIRSPAVPLWPLDPRKWDQYVVPQRRSHHQGSITSSWTVGSLNMGPICFPQCRPHHHGSSSSSCTVGSLKMGPICFPQRRSQHHGSSSSSCPAESLKMGPICCPATSVPSSGV